MAAKEDEKEAAKRFNETVNAHNESVRVHNQAARAYDKAWEALHNAEGDPTGELQAALNDAWNKYQQAKQAMDKKKEEEDAAEIAYGNAQTNSYNKWRVYSDLLDQALALGKTDYDDELLGNEGYYELTLAQSESQNVKDELDRLNTLKEELKTARETKEAKQEAYDTAVRNVETAQTELDAAKEALKAISEVYDSSDLLTRAQNQLTAAQTAYDDANKAQETALTQLNTAQSNYTRKLGEEEAAERALNEAVSNCAFYTENSIRFLGEGYSSLTEKLNQVFGPLGEQRTYNADLSNEMGKIKQAHADIEATYTSEENQNARAAIADAQAKLNNKDILAQRRDDLKAASLTAQSASEQASNKKATASTNKDQATQVVAEKQSSYDQLSAKALQAQSDLNAAESALVSLQEAYDRALSLQGSSTNEMSDARNALDAAKAKQESLNARFNALMATVSNAESELKQAKEESNGVQALSWESALRSPVLMPAYAYLNSFVEAYRALQNPLRAAEDRMNAAYETMNSNKRIFDTAVGNLSDANEAVKTAQANYDQALVSASSNQAPVKKSTPSANTDPLPFIVVVLGLRSKNVRI